MNLVIFIKVSHGGRIGLNDAFEKSGYTIVSIRRNIAIIFQTTMYTVLLVEKNICEKINCENYLLNMQT